MGGGNIKNTTLKKSELIDFQNMSYLSKDLIISLHKQFVFFSSIETDDGMIDYNEFCLIIGREENSLTKKLFHAIDSNKDNRINFREFLKFISSFITGSKEDHILLSFKIFADEETEEIDKNLFYCLIKSCLRKENSISEYFDDDTLIDIVNETFKLVESDVINYVLYKNILNTHSDILNWFTIDINKLKDNDILKSSNCSIRLNKK